MFTDVLIKSWIIFLLKFAMVNMLNIILILRLNVLLYNAVNKKHKGDLI